MTKKNVSKLRFILDKKRPFILDEERPYLAIDNHTDWHSAETYCNNMDSNLATITSSSDRDTAKTLCQTVDTTSNSFILENSIIKSPVIASTKNSLSSFLLTFLNVSIAIFG